ncbi:MAG TPA: MarC family protein [Polyangiaceae bacterium]|nr:MarC family protein [Polyangiaceae bacterium]
MSDLNPFVHLLFLAIIALLPVVNPLGTAFIVMPYFAGTTHAERKRAVRRITLYAFVICTVALFVGHWIMGMFGISLPVVQLAGGIMICKFGWESLSDSKDKEPESPTEQEPGATYQHLAGRLFYPITFPMTTGAGTMSVLFTLSAHGTKLRSDWAGWVLDMAAIELAVIVMCALVYLCYLNTEALVRVLGAEGEKIFNRIIAFLIFCVGLQIASAGAKALFVPTH